MPDVIRALTVKIAGVATIPELYDELDFQRAVQACAWRITNHADNGA